MYFTNRRVGFVCKYFIQIYCVVIPVQTQREGDGVIHSHGLEYVGVEIIRSVKKQVSNKPLGSKNIYIAKQ